ncbi:MAG: acyl-CoA desaturase [Pseudanabaena sp.]|jgi:fatty-acid desaturase|nr:fatty acid desaturase [Pseudanabaena sp. M051S1SP2A07QC]MCA6573761.1 fatty acid desaturase [Pseudanabaena sp. M53BS1SP1A06MG]MCA6580490.1 fatty acid desaturase [Pseudanabaena sp. M34BS1SP1A06MG]MCA6592516.1 fatty acid desaturase [Pseudanabaena sp. M38BS1SP1A06MG]MCA6595492.1 fatty acid desaturase [Pseudanabaena sp. M046S1SP1A06QC]MCA6612795.1 fatty acid desaturase [Pseudanabaena sp. M158S2SP1A06QC]MCA6624827.1 fatty acid desaturase [Pseudanabaena sp. M165S2SP1A06QC]MCE2977899.1 fatty acid
MSRLFSDIIPEPQPEQLKLSWVSVGFFTIVHALALLAPWFFSWSALGITILLHWFLGSIGICLGYHRLLSHRSFQVPKWLEYVIALIGAAALQGGPIFWIAGHRLHHAHTEDEEKDPYSARKGFWWSHMLWILYPKSDFFDADKYFRYAPDLARDPFYLWLDKYFLLLQIPVGVGLYLLGGWAYVIWGMCVRSVFLWHSTWFINSVTHMWGYRTFETNDNSRNLWWAAIATYGEGWHNNHHAYPNVAKAGWRWWEIDVTWWAIQVLRVLGLATKVIIPPAIAK